MAQINKSSNYFNTITYTGDGTSPRSLTGVGFKPDFLWIKNRTGASTYEHRWMDVVRGSNKVLHCSNNGAENTEEYYTVSSFDSDGWTGRSGTGSNQVITGGNDSGYTFVAWNWLAGGTASSNTDGSITSSVSANTTSGFSIVSYTGTGSAATVGHGLGATPKMIIVKRRDTTGRWQVYHNYLGATKYLFLEGDQSTGVNTATNRWNDTEPTSSVFSLGTSTEVNGSSATYITYCFAEKNGYSKIGSYTGNGSTDGTFVYCGFKPAFVLLKKTTGDNWTLLDNKRDVDNPAAARMLPNLNYNEASSNTIDFYSNGFKLLRTDAGENGSGVAYVFMAFAEQPLVGTNNIPATAR